MKMKYFIIFFLLILILSGCIWDRQRDSIVSLDYQGYGDTTLALLYGKTLDFENRPLEGIRIIFCDSNFETTSDSLGNFEIYSSNAKYNVFFLKEGFQTVLLKGYISQSDQTSRIEIQLSASKTDTLVINGSPD